MLSLCLLVGAVSPAPEDGKIVAASLFKNGYAVIVREAILRSGEAVVRPPGGTVLGTLWISAGRGVSLDSAAVVALKKDGQRDASSLDEIIQANFEKNVTLETVQGAPGQSTIVKGRIIGIQGSIVVLEGEGDVRVALPKSSVLRVLAAEHGLNFRLPSATAENVIRIKGRGDGPVYLVTLQRGMTWAPSYQVDITDDKRLTLTGKATILDDLAPLEGVDVSLVTGFPNMRFLNIPDPLTSGASVDLFLQSLAYSATPAEYKRDMMSQNAAPMGAGFGGGGFSEPQPNGTGELLEDLFLYHQPGVTLQVGERGYYVILKSQADYRRVYTVDLPDTTGSAQPVPLLDKPEEPADVWSTLKFKNDSGQPFTTGPVLTMKAGQMMGQDLMQYTSAGAETTVRVTKALDVRAEVVEEEVSRERGFLKVNDRAAFDRVTLKGTVELANHKGTQTDLEVSKAATGEVTTALGAEVRKIPAGLRQVNPQSRMLWKLSLNPGESRRLTYTIQVLVPTSGS